MTLASRGQELGHRSALLPAHLRDRFFVAGDLIDEAKIARYLAAHDDFARGLLRVFSEVAPDGSVVRPVLIVLRDRTAPAPDEFEPRRESFYLNVFITEGVDYSRIEERLATVAPPDHWDWGPRRVRSLPRPDEAA